MLEHYIIIISLVITFIVATLGLIFSIVTFTREDKNDVFELNFPLLSTTNGTADKPVYSFANNTSTGIFADDNLNFSRNGIKEFSIQNNVVQAQGFGILDKSDTGLFYNSNSDKLTVGNNSNNLFFTSTSVNTKGPVNVDSTLNVTDLVTASNGLMFGQSTLNYYEEYAHPFTAGTNLWILQNTAGITNAIGDVFLIRIGSFVNLTVSPPTSPINIGNSTGTDIYVMPSLPIPSRFYVSGRRVTGTVNLIFSVDGQVQTGCYYEDGRIYINEFDNLNQTVTWDTFSITFNLVERS